MQTMSFNFVQSTCSADWSAVNFTLDVPLGSFITDRPVAAKVNGFT